MKLRWLWEVRASSVLEWKFLFLPDFALCLCLPRASRLDEREAEDDALKVGDGARNLGRRLPSPLPLLSNSAVHTEKVLEWCLFLGPQGHITEAQSLLKFEQNVLQA